MYNPTFANTLLLVGSIDLIPSIEALASPSQLLAAEDSRTIHPLLHPFSISQNTAQLKDHPLPAILQEADKLARQYRQGAGFLGRDKAKLGSGSRRNSDDLSPGGSPSRFRRIKALPELPTSDDFRPRSGSDATRPAARPELGSKRASTLGISRNSILFGRRGSSSSTTSDADSPRASIIAPSAVSSGGCPIDSVINFIPSAKDIGNSDNLFREMLHQAVVSTTGLIPLLTKKPSKPASIVSEMEDSAITLIHVLPTQVPVPLPGVIENFLISLWPNLRGTTRDVWTSAITQPAWMAENATASSSRIQVMGEAQYSGSEVLLLGGVRSFALESERAAAGGQIKPRAFLPNWAVCEVSPGVVEHVRSIKEHSRPPPSRAVTTTVPRPLHPDPKYHRAISHPLYPTHQAIPIDTSIRNGGGGGAAPSTPELDPSSSSSCSASENGTPDTSADSHTDEGVKDRSTDEKMKKNKKGGLSTWFRKNRR